MAINYPTSLDNLTNPTSGQTLAAVDHAGQHSDANDAIEALEAKVGANSSAVTTSHDYKLSGVATGDKAVSKTGTETLTNKTLTSPVINVGSDGTGDTYYRNSGGAIARLPIGTSGQIMSASSGGLPEWIANPSAADSSTTVKGVVEKATTAEITAGTSAGATGAQLFIGADAVGVGASKLVQFNASTQYPAADGSLITNLTNPLTYKSGVTTYDSSTASGSQTIAHGLGKTPKFVRIKAMYATGAAAGQSYSDGSYNGTSQSCIYKWFDTNGNQNGVGNAAKIAHLSFGSGSGDSNYAEAVASIDSTNITLTWTKTSSPTGTYQLLWEAEA